MVSFLIHISARRRLSKTQLNLLDEDLFHRCADYLSDGFRGRRTRSNVVNQRIGLFSFDA
jgi:hypothetical protein